MNDKLIDDAMTPCVMIDKKRVPDKEGGVITQYVESAEFMAAIDYDTSIQAKTAGQLGVTSLYKVIIPKGVVLGYHDIFKRLSDGQIFRITDKSGVKQTPKMASFQVQKISAEEWSLTS